MGDKTGIEWTDRTWNPITGCTKISAGCKNCYAERQAERLQRMGNKRYVNGFNVTVHTDKFEEPLRWGKEQMVFVNSMSDLFHKDVWDSIIDRIFETMVKADKHVFQVLTKRAARMKKYVNERGDLAGEDCRHVWLGTSVESEKALYRVDHLRETNIPTKFLSIEPLIGPLPNLDVTGIDWVIVGGESGPGCRPMEKEWVEEIQEKCAAAGVPFFFKQWGGLNKKAAGRELNGKTYSEWPTYFKGLSV